MVHLQYAQSFKINIADKGNINDHENRKTTSVYFRRKCKFIIGKKQTVGRYHPPRSKQEKLHFYRSELAEAPLRPSVSRTTEPNYKFLFNPFS